MANANTHFLFRLPKLIGFIRSDTVIVLIVQPVVCFYAAPRKRSRVGYPSRSTLVRAGEAGGSPQPPMHALLACVLCTWVVDNLFIAINPKRPIASANCF